MLIGEAVLTSAAFSPRLILLVQDLRAAGYTVWLEGLRLRFDLDTRPDAEIEPADPCALLEPYRDVIEWFSEPSTELALVAPAPHPQELQKRPAPKRFFRAKNSEKPSRAPNP